jgi:hypothetical protein
VLRRGHIRDALHQLRANLDGLAWKEGGFDHMLRLGWIKPAESIEVRFGTSRAGAVDVALFRTADVDALPSSRTEVDWEQLRAVGKGRRSPLASLLAEPEVAPP